MPVRIDSFVAAGVTPEASLADVGGRLAAMEAAPHCIFAFYHEDIDDVELHRLITERLPDVTVIGGTSSHGLISPGGIVGGYTVGMLAIFDPDGRYGAAGMPLGDDPVGAAQAALHQALINADAEGELPELVWVYQAPGTEELVLDGIKRVVGDRCPIVGGSASDENISGKWRQLAPQGSLSNGVAVAVLLPSGGVSVAFQGGYEPTGASGLVTAVVPGPHRSDGEGLSNEIISISGRPAAEVYDEWCGGLLAEDWRENGQDIKRLTVGDPLGVAVAKFGAVTYFQLVQPGAVTPEGHLRTYTGVESGARVYAMRGSRRGLIRRASRVVATATSEIRSDNFEVAGGLMVYCAGCRLAVGEGITDVADAVRAEFGGSEFLGVFTGGEQGPVFGRAIHANLMISAVVFGR